MSNIFKRTNMCGDFTRENIGEEAVINGGKQILGLLQDSCRGAGRTVAIVTHNQAFTQIADRVIYVREGGARSVELNDHPADAASVEW